MGLHRLSGELQGVSEVFYEVSEKLHGFSGKLENLKEVFQAGFRRFSEAFQDVFRVF